MIKPLHNYLIVAEESTNQRTGMFYRMIDEQLLQVKIVSISEQLKEEYPYLNEGSVILIKPFNALRIRVEGTPSLLVEINDVVGLVES
ncbi:TPA: hypothetical protein GXZ54_05570 [bacterium]|nr:hypothetical protein [bacterium]